MKFKATLIILLIACVFSCKKEESKPFVTKILISESPNKSVYKTGETLDLSGLIVILYYNNNVWEGVAFEDFLGKGLICTPENGSIMSLTTDKIIVTQTESNQSATKELFVYNPTVTDYDGNNYGVTKIGNQLWMTDNLKVTHYPDGSLIPTISDDNINGSTNDEWAALGINDDAICFFNDNSSSPYGALYTWSASLGGGTTGSDTKPSHIQGVCPTGWHLPSGAEWYDLLNFVFNDGHSAYGTALKSTSGWYNDDNGTDIYGFSGLPGGYRDGYTGSFLDQNKQGQWWNSSEGNYNPNLNEKGAYSYYLIYNSVILEQGGGLYGNKKTYGFSVRCVKD
jgi:uncharacterized protein (TIGR02145 family)